MSRVKTWKPCVTELDDGTFIATIEKKTFWENYKRYPVYRKYSENFDFLYFASNAKPLSTLEDAMSLAVAAAQAKNKEDSLYSVVKIHYPATDPNKTL